MELYVLRHGTTPWNEKHFLQGQTDVPLDDAGRALAVETGEGLKDTHFDLCFTSPLKRAVETAELVLRDRGVPIIPDSRLAEMNFGAYEGTCVRGDTEICRRVKKCLEMEFASYETPPGGESLEELAARTKDFYDEITHNPSYEEKRILLSMHGASGRALMLNAWGRGDFWHGSVPRNCTICIVTLKEGAVTGIEQDKVFYKSVTGDFFG